LKSTNLKLSGKLTTAENAWMIKIKWEKVQMRVMFLLPVKYITMPKQLIFNERSSHGVPYQNA